MTKSDDSKPSNYRFARAETLEHAVLQDEAPLKGGAVQPDWYPHFARPALPARNRLPRKRILVPWLLCTIFFLITLWFTSILVGARFLSIVRPSLVAQEIHIYIDGELFEAEATSQGSHAAATSSAPMPSPTTPNIGNDLGRASSDIGGRIAPAPTGFVTMTTRARA
ncbi:uncharacterized protein SETTUDRAFT_24934 [Exserohilum turcica Et28A]|uniref:Uncharacterized protein n=1 Tax=Exserohilum turcicum (strain 28A) TaxID=671987 RepID=R0J214_EXST2|nr:uncharacterized protein SETTUDRAFT_24934 [Exserohilum turcica Et28A]EOA90806.1 hypothetical protein SETTUDRAFT_24934 [Exserohilum turcica Et28A]